MCDISKLIRSGYVVYQLIKRYRNLRHQRTYPNRYQTGKRSELAIPHNNYSSLSPLTTGRSGEHLAVSSSSQFLPTPSSAGLLSSPIMPSADDAGGKVPRLDWRPPALTPWSRSFKFTKAERDAELGRIQDTVSETVSFPARAYSEQGRFKEKIAMVRSGFGFGKSKGNMEGEAYLMMDGSPPVGSPPPQYAKSNEVTSSHIANIRSNGAVSPALPPIPQTPVIPPTTDPSITTEVASEINLNEEKETVTATQPTETSIGNAPGIVARRQSRPPSRSPTVKGSRLTSTTIASHSGRISTIVLGPTPNPSPRVSSLIHSRHSTHLYTPASPGLPDPLPPIPPMPALPGHLMGRVPSFKSVHAKKDSLGSVVERMGQEHDGATHNSTTSHASAQPNSTLSPTDLTKGLDGKPLPRTMVVTATFTPSLSDELPLSIGETVSMLEEYIDGWCFVQRVKILVKPKPGPQPNSSDVIVSVHGTIDVSNTITVPVEGEGNSGAVPRFCVSEWPLSPSTISHMQGGPSIGSPVAPLVQVEANIRNALPPTSLLSSVHIDPETAEKMNSPLHPISIPHPPPSSLLPTTIQVSMAGEQNLDSKFSSWGSIATAPRTTANAAVKEGIHASPLGTLHEDVTTSAIQLSFAAEHTLKSSLLNPNSAGQLNQTSTNLAPSLPRTTSLVIATDTSDTSRTTSTTSDASYAPPAPPPTSPVSITQSSPEGSVKRVSKPPPAPRISRFPSPERDVVDPAATFPTVPRASERTMTMPPLARGATLTDNVAAQPQPSSNVLIRKPSNGPWFSDGSLVKMDSTTSISGASGSGSSFGSKTPSTAQTLSSDNSANPSMSKRFTSASGRGTLPGTASTTGSRSGGNPSTFGPRAKPGGPGVVSFRSLRTGSTTANVTAGTIQR